MPSRRTWTKCASRYEGRIQFCISDFTIKDGLRFSPQELVEWQKRGVMGFKFYPGWQRGVQIDQPANDPTFYAMEQIGMVATSPHVSNPCGTFGKRTEWFAEPRGVLAASSTRGRTC